MPGRRLARILLSQRNQESGTGKGIEGITVTVIVTVTVAVIAIVTVTYGASQEKVLRVGGRHFKRGENV